jgi:acyl-CoA thioesterase-1
VRCWSSRAAAALTAALMIAGCSEAPRPVLPATPARPERLTVVFLGDSLTAGLGVDPASAFPAIVQAYWARKGIPYTAINEGVSGDTTADVLARLGSSRSPAAELTILEIGANDAFQGVPTETIAANVKRIIERVRGGGSRVALASMYFSDGFVSNDAAYTHRFNALYAEIGRAENVPVLPVLLRSLFTRADLWQADGVHPTAAGHALVARDLLGDLNPEWKE